MPLLPSNSTLRLCFTVELLVFVPFVLFLELPLYFVTWLGIFRYITNDTYEMPFVVPSTPRVTCAITCYAEGKAVQNTVSVLGADRFNVISIGFNQPFDSPQALKDFSVQYGISLPNWEFLSPSPAILDDLTANFGFSYVATPAGFDHLNQITMVDAEGKIFRQVYGEKFNASDLAEPLKAMIAGAAIPPEKDTLKEIMERVRILCSVYDPVTGRYRTNYSVYFMIAGFLTFTGFTIYLCFHVWTNRRRRVIPSA